MVGYVQWKRTKCSGCGIDAQLARDPHSTFSLTDELCWACKIREDKEDALRKAAEKNKTPGATNGVKVYISKARPNPKAVTDG